tara:strand:- start:616 stop:1869 length:1254 start_codon:yes stop_codon:yes gene_type:complete
MNNYDSDELIKILFYSDIIINNYNKNKTNNNVPNTKNINIESNLFTQYYKHNDLNILNNNIEEIKNIYNLNDSDISNIISYYFINNIFNISDENTYIHINNVNKLNDDIKNNDFMIKNKCELNDNDIKRKISDNINMSYNTEQLYNPYKYILGYIIYNKNDEMYNDIIRYTSNKYLLLNKPITKYNINTYDTFNKIILNIINDKQDVTSYNIIQYINKYKNINYEIDVILPFYIIKHFNPKNILTINNDYGQWLYASNIIGINKLITKNQYKFDNDTIKNIKKLTEKNVIFKTVDNNYIFDDNDIDLIYYDCNNLHEHTNNNIKDIIFKENYYNIKMAWDQLNENGYLLINLYDVGNKKITELMNLYIDKLYNSEYKGIFCVHKKKNIYPIWVFKKNIINKPKENINDIYNNIIDNF